MAKKKTPKRSKSQRSTSKSSKKKSDASTPAVVTRKSTRATAKAATAKIRSHSETPPSPLKEPTALALQDPIDISTSPYKAPNDEVQLIEGIDPPKLKRTGDTFASITRKGNDDTPQKDNQDHSMNSFLVAKKLNESPLPLFDEDPVIYIKDNPVTDASDDDTAVADNVTPFYRKRFKINVGLPTLDKGVTMETAPIILLEKVNQMIQVISNAHQGLVIIPWVIDDPLNLRRSTTFQQFPTDDMDFCEKHLFGFNRFASPGGFFKMRIHLAFPDTVDLPSLLETCDSVRRPREQRIEPAPSDAASPLTLGTLTGSVKAMSTSHDFYKVFKTMFQLRDLGFTWEFPANSGNLKYSSSACKLHIEINTLDRKKKDTIEQYFNNPTSQLTKSFFGTNMTLVPVHERNLERAAQRMVNRHCQLQADFGNNLEMERVTGFALNNWFESEHHTTLHQKLMSVDSITKKVVGSGKNQRSFFGRLFYAIIYDRQNREATFYFLPANDREARSVVQALPLFIRDEFGIDPTFYCSYDKYKEVEEGHWNHSTRRFLTKFEKDDEDRTTQLKEALTAQPEADVYISKEHARALQTQTDPIDDEDTVLTKHDKNPQKVTHSSHQEVINLDDDGGSLSDMTGSTKSSKAKRYANEAVKAATEEFLKGQAVMHSNLLEKDNRIQEKDNKIMELMEQLERLRNVEIATNDQPSDPLSDMAMSVDNSVPNTGGQSSSSGSKRSKASIIAESTDTHMHTTASGEKTDELTSHQGEERLDDFSQVKSPLRKRKNANEKTYSPGARANSSEQAKKHQSYHSDESGDDEPPDLPSDTITSVENPPSGPSGGNLL
jgi:hypothetical protein